MTAAHHQTKECGLGRKKKRTVVASGPVCGSVIASLLVFYNTVDDDTEPSTDSITAPFFYCLPPTPGTRVTSSAPNPRNPFLLAQNSWQHGQRTRACVPAKNGGKDRSAMFELLNEIQLGSPYPFPGRNFNSDPMKIHQPVRHGSTFWQLVLRRLKYAPGTLIQPGKPEL